MAPPKNNNAQQHPFMRSISRGDSSSAAAVGHVHDSERSISLIDAAKTTEVADDTSTTMTHAVPLDDTTIAANTKPHHIRVSTSLSMMDGDGDVDDQMPPPQPSTTSTTSAFSPAGMATAMADGDVTHDSSTNHNVADEDDDDDSTNRCAVSCAGEEQEDDEEEESDYEYDYDDDDDGHFQGFLEPAEDSAVLAPYQQVDNGNNNNPNVIENTDATTTAADTASASTSNAASGPSQNNNSDNNNMILGSLADHLPPARAGASSAKSSSPERKKSSWKEPSQAAVSMSLRAEREKSGGKRRLASDLYKIMMGDTTEQGFKMEPTSEDSMDLWTIKLFGFDKDSNLSKDMDLLGLENVELEMSFPDDYPFAPPFVRVVRPRFKRQTGFVMNGALCMELLTTDGWNPVNDIESVIVSIRSLLVVGDGRLEAATQIESDEVRAAATRKKKAAVAAAAAAADANKDADGDSIMRNGDDDADSKQPGGEKRLKNEQGKPKAVAARPAMPDDLMDYDDGSDKKGASIKKRNSGKISAGDIGSYSASEARSAYSHLSDYHKRKGWDSSGWWARKG